MKKARVRTLPHGQRPKPEVGANVMTAFPHTYVRIRRASEFPGLRGVVKPRKSRPGQRPNWPLRESLDQPQARRRHSSAWRGGRWGEGLPFVPPGPRQGAPSGALQEKKEKEQKRKAAKKQTDLSRE